MRRVATLRIKRQYEEYRLSAVDNSGESIKKRENFIGFEAKFEKCLNTDYRVRGLGGVHL